MSQGFMIARFLGKTPADVAMAPAAGEWEVEIWVWVGMMYFKPYRPSWLLLNVIKQGSCEDQPRSPRLRHPSLVG